MTLERTQTRRYIRTVAVLLCAALAPGNSFALALGAGHANPQTSSQEAPRIPSDQLDSLVAPIALYPDPLLAQILAASTYPLELLQLHQWLQKHTSLKDQALADAVAQQPWDPSIQAMAVLPDVVKRLADDIQWTTDLGNAFLAQQTDVMDAVQRMRGRAQQNGNLKSTPQQTVETEVVENKQVIVIEQADPEVVYVPSYNPVTVWGAPAYPYPPVYYPPPGYYAAGMAVSFGVGVAMGAAWGGGWGWGCGWGDNDITINNNNNFNRNANVNAGNRNVSGSGRWQHRSEHRGGAPYRDRATANKYGGAARGDSLAQRQAGARQQIQRQGGTVRGGATGTTGLGERAAASNLGTRSGGNVGSGSAGAAGSRAANRPSGATAGSRASGGADRVGSRELSRSSGGSSRSAFGDGGGYSGSSARSSSSRGSSSIERSRSGSGLSQGGSRGSRGGGSRGGGGGSRGGSRGGGGRR
jgi:hypothetical protein